MIVGVVVGIILVAEVEGVVVVAAVVVLVVLLLVVKANSRKLK